MVDNPPGNGRMEGDAVSPFIHAPYRRGVSGRGPGGGWGGGRYAVPSHRRASGCHVLAGTSGRM
ncbi:hypothetical protein SCOCK_340012 [Actinacidiphila cocklensis]|uniref:Uncharacterized protein n=1 Tax=Actinacidiphila cocklensis TaxID=887465 RepID=A0A9W4GTA3_9ACTN|nr:hypothetical protein SCOCK_340012 [Actinacidiphila cocklensis]